MPSEIPVRTASHIRDSASTRAVRSREMLQESFVQTFVREEFELNETTVLTRDFILHPGAVVVVALNERNEVLLLRQYRHPMRRLMWECPAGLLDVPGEPPVLAAPRELLEEADLQARTWHTLVDFANSAGGSNEASRVYLAQDISEVPEEDLHQREAEEQEIELAWVPIEEAVAAISAGAIHNSGAVVGILAASSHLRGELELRPADAPWETHPDHRSWGSR